MINRSIVYGLLTLILAIVFGVILYGLQTVYTVITHRNNPPTIAIVISTIVVSSIFQPTRQGLRRFVNRKVYGMDVDIDEMKRRSTQIDRIAHLPAHDIASVGGYESLELIARGGMGEVYKARHPSLNRVVAIKILSSYLKDETDLKRRFAREAKTMAQLRHPNIITIHDFGEQDGLPYIVMEYLTGQTLSQVLADHTRLSLEQAMPVLQDLGSALDYAHGQGVIHRDIKPSNVIIEPVTTSTAARVQRAILMDFGIARFLAENTMITVTGDMLGTADYISPEQVHDSDSVDHRADIYSFGVMTYQVLTGRKPFERNNTWAMIRSHIEEPPPDARDIVPSLSASTAKAIIRAMAKKPEDRFASVGEFIRELGNILINCEIMDGELIDRQLDPEVKILYSIQNIKVVTLCCFRQLLLLTLSQWQQHYGARSIFLRGFPSRITLRAVIVLLLLSIFFLGAYNNLFHQVAGTAALRAVLLILGLGSWYSLTYRLMPQQSRERHRWMEIAIYILGGVTAVALLTIPDAFIDEQGNDLYVAHMRIGFPYILYGTFQVVIALGMLYNLLVDDRIGLARQGEYFVVASLFPAFVVASGVIGLALLPRLPRIIPDLLIFSGMFLLGLSVARHQTPR